MCTKWQGGLYKNKVYINFPHSSVCSFSVFSHSKTKAIQRTKRSDVRCDSPNATPSNGKRILCTRIATMVSVKTHSQSSGVKRNRVLYFSKMMWDCVLVRPVFGQFHLAAETCRHPFAARVLLALLLTELPFAEQFSVKCWNCSYISLHFTRTTFLADGER